LTGKVKVGNRAIGEGEPAFVIAEVGSNHNQDMDQAKALIRAAQESGADAVKFQLFSADILYPGGGEMHDAFRAVELDRDWLPEIAEYSQKQGIIFFASPFDEPAVDRMADMDVAAYKVASSETTKLGLLRYMAAKQKPVLISTGMCDLADVSEAIDAVRSEGNNDITLFQCTALYPTEPRLSNLRGMDTLRAAFGIPTGLSDHTLGITVAIAAVARGANLIEKTLTLSRSLPGPDHSYALEPHEFRAMVDGIRDTEAALGSPLKSMLAEEAQLARREVLRAARDIAVGETVTQADLVAEGPALGGVRPRLMGAMIGRTAKTAIAKGTVISWDAV